MVLKSARQEKKSVEERMKEDEDENMVEMKRMDCAINARTAQAGRCKS